MSPITLSRFRAVGCGHRVDVVLDPDRHILRFQFRGRDISVRHGRHLHSRPLGMQALNYTAPSGTLTIAAGEKTGTHPNSDRRR